MNELLEQLGIDWKLLLSQAVNFFIILVALTFFVYKPLIKVIKQRNERIKEGLKNAEEADKKLKEIDDIGKEKVRQAEAESVQIIKATEGRVKVLQKEMHKELEQEHDQLQKALNERLKKQKEEAHEKVMKDAVELVKKAIIKTVQLKPGAVDEALIKKAAEQVKNEAE